MKKSKLVSLLAIPFFSLATISSSFSATPFNSYQESQESKKIKTKTVAASVIKFLLGNPKTVDKMNPTQQIALGLIGDLFETQGQREHEIDYATAGRDQFTINTTDGRQAQFVKDESGKIYLVFDGVIHPLAQELVNQARSTPTIENAILPPYNLRGLENMFNSNPKKDEWVNYQPKKGGEYLSDIAKKFDVPKSNIFIWKPEMYDWIPIQKKKKIWENRRKIKGHNLVIGKEKYKNQISAVFSYKWHQDLNSDSKLDFNEFNQIKRTFYNDEDFNIGIQYQTEKGFKGNLELKILEDYTGKLLVNEKMKILSNGPMIGQQHIPTGSLPIGVYLIHTNLISGGSGTVSSKSEKFEVVQKPSKTPEKK